MSVDTIMHWQPARRVSLTGFMRSVLLRVPGGLDHDALSAAVAVVVERHELLRVGAAEVSRVETVAALEDRRRLAQADPAMGPMLRVIWCDGTHGQLWMIAHNLVLDRVSWRVLVSDLVSTYRLVARGEAPLVPPVGTSVRQWADGLLGAAESRAGELDLWLRVLEPAPGLGFRRQVSRDVVGTVRSVARSLSEVDTGSIVAGLSSLHGVSVGEALLASLAAAVAPWRGSPVVVVNVEGHGREVPGADLSRTVGWFTSMYPVRLDIGEVDWPQLWDAGLVVGDILKRISEQLRAIPDSGIGYGLLRYLNPHTREALAALPTPEIAFTYLDTVEVGGGWDIMEFRAGNDPGVPCAHSLEMAAAVHKGRLCLTVSWPEALFAEDEIVELADTWVRVLRAFAAHGRQPDDGQGG